MLEINHRFFRAFGQLRDWGRLLSLLMLGVFFSGCTTSILDASARGDLEELESILSEDSDAIDIKNNLGQSAIHYAALHNRLDSLKVLLEHGVDVNAQDGTGQTALHIATVGDHVFIVKALIAGGADLMLVDDFGDTALHSAALHGGERATKELLEAGYNADDLNAQEASALDLARRFEHVEVVLLLEASLKE